MNNEWERRRCDTNDQQKPMPLVWASAVRPAPIYALTDVAIDCGPPGLDLYGFADGAARSVSSESKFNVALNSRKKLPCV